MCSNRNCDKNPLNMMDAICVSIDGDFVCDEHCKREFEKQRDHFFGVICQSEETTQQWLMGEIE